MNPHNDSTAIEAIAASWFAKREGDTWTPADQIELETWLNEATAHRIAYLRLVTAWERSGRLKAIGAGIPAGMSQSSTQSASPSRKFRHLGLLAASVAVMTLAVTLWILSMGHTSRYSTEVGALATVPLADGSTITLNTDSEIRVDLASRERIVTLDHGEAFFAIAKDPMRPFVVKIGNRRVTAVGTQFTVRCDQNDIRVLVTEGRVQVARNSLLTSSAATQVDAGSAARTRGDSVIVDQPKPGQIDESLSWRSGYLIFHETPLADAIAEFNRYNIRKIIIADPSIAALRIGGRFRFTDSAAFLWLLQNGFPISVTQDSTSIRLTRR